MKALRIRSTRRGCTTFAVTGLTSLLLSAVSFSQEPGSDIPRRADGRPDLTGTYDVATLTPLERPVEYGDKLALTDEEAAEIGRSERRRRVVTTGTPCAAQRRACWFVTRPFQGACISSIAPASAA